jgi:hypothetical protein
MFVPARGSIVTPHRLHFFLLLVLWITIAGGLLAAKRATAAPAETDSAAYMMSRGSARIHAQPPPATPPPTAPVTSVYRIHLHGGLFEPIEVNEPSPTLGVRLGRRVVSHLHAGVLVDWTFERKDLTEPVNDRPGLQPHRILARADGHLVPAMVYLNVDLNETRFLAPYAGIATGYEWLFLKAADYRTDATASATYSNWAWVSWGGIGMRLDPQLRVDGEVFYNGASLERVVTDSSGASWREAVNANGAGARVGLNIQF